MSHREQLLSKGLWLGFTLGALLGGLYGASIGIWVGIFEDDYRSFWLSLFGFGLIGWLRGTIQGAILGILLGGITGIITAQQTNTAPDDETLRSQVQMRAIPLSIGCTFLFQLISINTIYRWSSLAHWMTWLAFFIIPILLGCLLIWKSSQQLARWFWQQPAA